MSETDTAPVPYSENNPDRVPNPLYQTGFVDTTGTTGETSVTGVSPVFDQARADAFGEVTAADDGSGDGTDPGDDPSEDDELHFKSKKAAEEYADQYDLDVDKSLGAEDYKQAVADAARAARADQSDQS